MPRRPFPPHLRGYSETIPTHRRKYAIERDVDNLIHPACSHLLQREPWNIPYDADHPVLVRDDRFRSRHPIRWEKDPNDWETYPPLRILSFKRRDRWLEKYKEKRRANAAAAPWVAEERGRKRSADGVEKTDHSHSDSNSSNHHRRWTDKGSEQIMLGWHLFRRPAFDGDPVPELKGKSLDERCKIVREASNKYREYLRYHHLRTWEVKWEPRPWEDVVERSEPRPSGRFQEDAPPVPLRTVDAGARKLRLSSPAHFRDDAPAVPLRKVEVGARTLRMSSPAPVAAHDGPSDDNPACQALKEKLRRHGLSEEELAYIDYEGMLAAEEDEEWHSDDTTIGSNDFAFGVEHGLF